MNLSEMFVRRPVMTTLVMACIAIFGVQSYLLLPVSDLPNVDFPTIQVSADLPGASPETMASAVATPLEGQFSTIAGIDSMVSSSAQGTTQITIQFVLSRDIDAAAQDVQTAIARATHQLPENMPTPPSFRKVNPADQPILMLSLVSPTLPLYELNEFGETLMAQQISMVDGVAQVLVYGSQKYAVRIQLDPQELASRNLGIDEVAAAVTNGNVNLPTGTLYGSRVALTVRADGQLLRAADYGPLVVAHRNGAPVRLRDIGTAYDSVENDKVAAWYCTPESQHRAIILAIQRQPGTNTIEVAKAVKRLLPVFKNQLPESVSVNILYDRSEMIDESSRDVQFTLLLTLGLVILVIFVFLRRLSATVIPSLALPMSVLGTFIVMGMLGYSLDNLSLMALTLAVGFVVDDAIVMLENIFRHMEMGKSKLQAALDGSKEVGFTIVSMTLSLAAVFVPVLFMGGLVGRLFREFAVTIGAAVMVSGVVSLTLTPMLSSRFLRHTVSDAHAPGEEHAPRGWMVRFYGWTLRGVLHHRLLVMVVSLVLLVATVDLFRRIPKGFLPSEDQGRVSIQTEAAEGISFRALFALQQSLAKVAQEDPSVDSFMSSAGARGGSAGTVGRMFLRLKPRSERALSADGVIQALRPKLAKVPGIRAYLLNPPVINIGGMMSKALYQYTLQSPDLEALYLAASRLLEELRALPALQDLNSDLLIKNPELDIEIDREKASSLGVSATQVEDALYTAFGSRQISTIYASQNQYQVIMELKPEFQVGPSALDLLCVRAANGTLVPLKAVTKFREDVGPLTVTHSGQLPAVTISFNLRPGSSLGPAVEAVNALAKTILPPTISTRFQGTAQAFQSSMKGMGLLFAMAILVIYVVLGILYESFIHPLTILTALPFAAFGALLTLLIFKVDLSLYAYVGIIMLIGLVKKNGIMMVDFAIEAQREGKPAEEAIVQACLIRFRPIMMTTVCALMAGLPIAFGWGAGAESRRPLGLSVVGGLLFSQTLTLYVTPVFYVYMDKLQTFLRRRRAPAPASPPHAA